MGPLLYKNRRNRGGDGGRFGKIFQDTVQGPWRMHWGAIGQWDVSCQCKSKPESPLGVQSSFQATTGIWPSWGCLEAVAGVCLKDEWKAEVDRYHAVCKPYHIFCLARTALDMLSKQLAEMCERFQHLSVVWHNITFRGFNMIEDYLSLVIPGLFSNRDKQSWAVWMNFSQFFVRANEQWNEDPWLFRVYVGIVLPSYVGITRNHYAKNRNKVSGSHRPALDLHTQVIWSNSNLTRPGPPKGNWGREIHLFQGKIRLVT